MGRRGPVPKRPEKRHGHRSKAEQEITLVTGAAAAQPALGMEVHPIVADWYAALGDGCEAQFYTPAMWQRARIAAQMLSGVLESGRPSSTMYAALQADMRSLLVDAGELRRLGITVLADTGPIPNNVIDWRARADKAARHE